MQLPTVEKRTELRLAYRVKEIFYTLQGEGAHAGRAAVFLRFSGCNLWSGIEADRSKSICQFCDTDFVGTDGSEGGIYGDCDALTDTVLKTWLDGVKGRATNPYVVCTGGEPLLQLDQKLVDSLHTKGFEVAIETNGTKLPPKGIDWICCSPKAGCDWVLKSGDELKLVYPQKGLQPSGFSDWDFKHFFIQPMDGPAKQANTLAAIEFCKANPKWRLSLQTHKILGIQ
jgi:7-carboxy-7-deazaguanine synthase (Cx14CxxC type)